MYVLKGYQDMPLEFYALQYGHFDIYLIDPNH